MDNGELRATTNCTSYITTPKSFKKLKLQYLGVCDIYLEHINSALARKLTFTNPDGTR